MTKDPTGYLHPQYALSLQEFGELRELPQCGGWILVRSIPNTPYKDAIGCYPLFACRNWSKLHEDLAHVGADLVSLAIVTDPFSGVAPAYLEQCFDLVKPFKTHYVTDLSRPLESCVDKGHRYYARKVIKMMDVEICCQPAIYLDDWVRLYNNLINRYNIKGINAFSRKSFEIQLNIPGMVMFIGRLNGEIVGATLVMIQDQVSYAHLSAYNTEGYKIRASYGIRWQILVYLSQRGIRYFDGGGTSGAHEDPRDGLSQFKKNWSNEQCKTYLCGRVFDRQKYESISQQYQMANIDYFPIYRAQEWIEASDKNAIEDKNINRDLTKKSETECLGYAHPQYALSLQEFGVPRELPRCGGWILVRPIPNTPYKDAIGCYPLFACRNWSELHEDLAHVGTDLVSVTLITDPFSKISTSSLEQCFDLVKPFKTHYISDLSYPLESFIDKDHRYKARKAQRIMDIEICYQPVIYLDDWLRLYDNLIGRHNIKGVNAFSKKSFEIQLNIPGMIMFIGRLEREIIGATLVLIQDQVAYFHLAAFTSDGYRVRASYGLQWAALIYSFERGLKYFSHGGVAGLKENPEDGLAQFKRGWSNERSTAYLCGRVFDRQKYDTICRQYQITSIDYFPAYRKANEPTIKLLEGTKNE